MCRSERRPMCFHSHGNFLQGTVACLPLLKNAVSPPCGLVGNLEYLQTGTKLSWLIILRGILIPFLDPRYIDVHCWLYPIVYLDYTPTLPQTYRYVIPLLLVVSPSDPVKMCWLDQLTSPIISPTKRKRNCLLTSTKTSTI